MEREEAAKIAERIVGDSRSIESGAECWSKTIIDVDKLRELITRELMLSRGGERAEDT